MTRFLRTLITFLLFGVVYFFSAGETFSISLLEDDFNDGNLDNWIPLRCSSKWNVENGRLHILVNTRNTICEIYTGDQNWNNYIFEYDFTPVAGVDKNIRYYWTDFGSTYEFHFNNEGLYAPDGNVYGVFLQNGTTYHIKLILEGARHQLFINSEKIYDYTIIQNPVEKGAIGFLVGTGAAFPTEVYFDNVKVTSIPQTLSVPYYSQNDPLWKLDEYDSVSALPGFGNPHFERWGCAVTSAAMVLNYNGMTEFEDGSKVTPGSLNEWLKQNEGYLTGTGKDGSYSYLVWGKISELSQKLYDLGKSAVKLEHKRSKSTSGPLDTSYLDFVKNLALVDNIPAIINVKNNKTDGHFVVATGEDVETITINDPEWNYPDLSSFNNEIYQIDYFKPSNTDLSYIVAVVNPDVELLVTNPSGSQSGKLVKNGQDVDLNSISNASYGYSSPISNPDIDDSLESLGTGVNELLIPQPETGAYTVQISSQNDSFYTINIVTFDENGHSNNSKIVGFTGDQADELEIDFLKQGTSSFEKNVTFDSAIDDVKEAFNTNEITDHNTQNVLLRDLRASKREYKKGNINGALLYLGNFATTLSERKNVSIGDIAYEVLLSDQKNLTSLVQ